MKNYSPRRPSGPPLTLDNLFAAARAERIRREQQAISRAHEARHAEDIEASRERCLELVNFIQEGWHVLEPTTRYVHGFHIDAVCVHLQALARRELTGNLLFNIPPGSMKSLIVSVFFPAYEWGPVGRPGLKYLTGAYERTLALRDNGRMKKLITSDWYQARWPIALVKNGEEIFENSVGGERRARAFRSMTGGRGNRVIVDDPHSTELAESDTERAKTIRIFRESLPDRINDVETDSIIVMMQRLHGGDVSGVIAELGLPYTKVMIPMEFEPDRRCVTSLWRDPRTYDGELMCPERWSRDAVEALKKAKGSYAYAGQYQQRPTPREGGLFKREWFEGRIRPVAPPGTVWVRHWDLAATELKATDMKGARTAGVKLGRAPDGSFWVGHCITLGVDGAKVPQIIRATAEMDGHDVEISLPQDPGQAGKVQKRSLVSHLAGFVARATPETGDKVTRAEPFAVQCEVGNVFLVKGDWNQEYIDEVCAFPGATRKDIVDATSGAFARLQPRRRNMKSKLAGVQLITAGDA